MKMYNVYPRKVLPLMSLLLLATIVPGSIGGKILEIQSKTSTETDAGKDDSDDDNDNLVIVGMNGGLTIEICDANLNCCNAGMMDSDRYICESNEKKIQFWAQQSLYV